MIQKFRGFPKSASPRHGHILSPLILAACGSSGQQGGSQPSISLSNGSYSGNLPDGFELTGSSSATIQVLNMPTNSDEILLSASGAGELEFSFVDHNDRLTLQSGSKVNGFNILKITNGAVDVTQASLTGIETIEVASEVVLNYGQVKHLKDILSGDSSGKILVNVRDDVELASFMSQLSSGQLKIYADANPLQLLNEDGSISVTMLETQQATTNSYVQLYSTYDNATANNAKLTINDDLFVTNASSETKLTAESSTKTIKLSNGTEVAADMFKYDAISNIEISQGKTLVLSANDFEMIEAEISGSGNLKVTDITLDSDFEGIKSSGAIELFGEAGAKSINALDEVVSNAIDASAITKISGSASDVKNVLDDQSSIITASNVMVVTTGASADLAILKFIEEKTTGFVEAIAHTSLTGTLSEAETLLVTKQGTSGDKIDTAAGINITLTGTQGNMSAANVSSLNSIIAATTGTVTASIDGNSTELDDLTATSGDMGISTLSITVDDAVTAAQGAAIAAATDAATVDFSAAGVLDTFANLTSTTAISTNLGAIDAKDANVAIAVSDIIENASANNVAALNAIIAATTGTVIATIDGNAAALDDLTATAGDAGTSMLNITVDDAVTAAQGLAITAATDAATVSFSAAGVSDTAANLVLNLVSSSSASTGLAAVIAKDADVNVAITGSSANAADIATLNSVVAGDVNISALTTIALHATNNENFSAAAAGLEEGSGTFTIYGGSGANQITGGDNADIISGGDGIDNLAGGSGDDIFVINGLADLTNGSNAVEDTIDGGGGSADKLAFSGGVTLTSLDDFSTKVSNVEQLTANGAQNSAISLTLHSDFVTDTSIVIIDLSADTNASGTNVIDTSNLTTTTAITITGSAGIDIITVDADSADVIKGGAGVDVIDMTGGIAADTIDFTGAHSGTGNYDTVANFVVGSDLIRLDASATTATTASAAAAVVEDEATAASNASGATYDLAAALSADTNSVDLVTLDTDVLANIVNADLDAASTINDGTELLKALVTVGGGNTAGSITVDNAGDKFYILTDDGTDSYLYFIDSGADNLVTADEIQLVADFATAAIDGIATSAITIA